MSQSNDDESFSSTLSTSELLLIKNLGITPRSQVMGTAFMRMPKTKLELQSFVYPGFPGLRSATTTRIRNTQSRSRFPGKGRNYSARYDELYGGNYTTSYGQAMVGEVTELTGIRLDARKLAVERMRLEAENIGASGVIAVEMKTEVHFWGDCLTFECTAMGTAVDVPEWQEERAFTSLMRAQQFWKLWQKGYQPYGIAIGACTYCDCAEASVLQRSYNQEVASYSASFHEAHELAMQAFSLDVKKHGGIGAVGVKVDFDFEDLEKEIEIGEGVEAKYMHLLTHFVMTGTVIRKRENFTLDKPQRTLRILDLSQVGEKRSGHKEAIKLDESVKNDDKFRERKTGRES